MFISKKKMFGISSILFSLIILAFFGTPCYQYGALGRGFYFNVYEFGYGGNITVEAILATLFSIIGAIIVFNLVALFAEQISEKIHGIVNISSWFVALVFAIASMFTKYINESYTPTNSMTFVLLTTIVGIIFSIYTLVVSQD